MLCYFQNCPNEATTKEHVPPKAFFPTEHRKQLITVRSCEEHNNDKSHDDQYVLAHICLNSSPNNGARDVFIDRIVPQLKYNEYALAKLLAKDARQLPEGAVAYRVDSTRFNRFFDALSCGIAAKINDCQLPSDYDMRHVFHNWSYQRSEQEARMEASLLDAYSGTDSAMPRLGVIECDGPELHNTNIYKATVFGLPDYGSSLTIVHDFYEHFKVTSMLSRIMYITK